jgi:putative FmdB family regulatory protein
MPIYEYRCEPCGRTVELLRRSGEAGDPVECPGCGGPMTRQFSAPGGIRVGDGRAGGSTCCGRDERCDSPPCGGGSCCRDD